MGRSLEILSKANHISKEVEIKLRRAIEMRNQAVHDLREPDRLEALQVYENIAEFMQKASQNM